MWNADRGRRLAHVVGEELDAPFPLMTGRRFERLTLLVRPRHRLETLGIARIGGEAAIQLIEGADAEGEVVLIDVGQGLAVRP